MAYSSSDYFSVRGIYFREFVKGKKKGAYWKIRGGSPVTRAVLEMEWLRALKDG